VPRDVSSDAEGALPVLSERLARAAVSGAVDATLTLPHAQRQKSRQRVRLDDGREVAIWLTAGPGLRDGDRLAGDGLCVEVRAAAEEISVARCDDPLTLARTCYHLGNRHVPLQVGVGEARYLGDPVLDAMARKQGARVERAELPFEPEPGAYAGGHSHGEGAHGHDTKHSHDD
jgi:urease accessory protein